MDTRDKILSLGEIDALLQTGEWVIAVGQFDPLTAAQARRLNALEKRGAKLLAVVLEGRDALLSGSARAALIAALRDVDAVTVADDGGWRAVLPANPHLRIAEDREAEERRSTEFIRYVVDRQATKSNGTGPQ